MEQDIVLHIGTLSRTDQKLMEIILYTIQNSNKDNYEKLAKIFNSRFEMEKTLEEINSNLST